MGTYEEDCINSRPYKEILFFHIFTWVIIELNFVTFFLPHTYCIGTVMEKEEDLLSRIAGAGEEKHWRKGVIKKLSGSLRMRVFEATAVSPKPLEQTSNCFSDSTHCFWSMLFSFPLLLTFSLHYSLS